MLHASGFSMQDRVAYARRIRQNIARDLDTVIKGMSGLGIAFEDPKTRQSDLEFFNRYPEILSNFTKNSVPASAAGPAIKVDPSAVVAPDLLAGTGIKKTYLILYI